MERGFRTNRPVHIINFDIKDNPEDATIGARAILQLAQRLEDSTAIEDEIEGIIDEFQAHSSHPMLYTVHYY